jgi:RimJ/RimL family protein N-acetyltransferase
MFACHLNTADPSIALVAPVVSRDAPLGMRWLAGDQGRETLRMMGVPEEEIRPTNLDEESARITSFLERRDQYNWMIDFRGAVVGAIWVDLRPSSVLPAPAVSYMIGAAEARRKGVASASLDAVAQFILRHGFTRLYARTLVINHKGAALLSRAGFVLRDEPYIEPDDGLSWQNFVLQLRGLD